MKDFLEDFFLFIQHFLVPLAVASALVYGAVYGLAVVFCLLTECKP